MTKFSTVFKINAPQAQLDFVDISTDYDLPVYVDPFAIEIRNDVWAAEASECIRTFFKEVLDAIRANDNMRATNLMSHLHEPEETFLGVSSGKPKGKGVGSRQAGQLISAIKSSRAFKTGILSDLSEMALYVDNIDKDKISDLTTNIIRRKLVQYTQDQCKLYNIPIHDYNGPPLWSQPHLNWISEIVKLPYIDEQAILLVPKYIVRRNLSLNSQEFYNKQITDFLVAENLKANSSLVHTLKGKRKVYKGEVRKAVPKSKSLIAEIVSKHPGMLDLYKKLAKETGMLINFDKDDPSVGRVCVELEAKLSATPKGKKNAEIYHQIAMGVITTCFYPKLVSPRKEWEINDGRKRLDIVYTNAADSGFFSHRRDAQNTAATMVIVECKNYSKDLNNPEIDQLLGRFDDNRGNFGIITCRSIGKKKRVLDKCRDLAKAKRGYILVLTDDDMIVMLKAKAVGDDDAIENMMHQKFQELIS